MDTLAHIHRLFAFDRWASARVNESLASARRSVEGGPGGAAAEVPALLKAIQIWSHVQWSRRLWLSRLGVAERPDLGEGMFPHWALEKAFAESALLDTLW